MAARANAKEVTQVTKNAQSIPSPGRNTPPTMHELLQRARSNRAATRTGLRDWVGELAAITEIPAEVVRAMVKALALTLLKSPQGTTPEGRSRIVQSISGLCEDAVLEAVTEVRLPAPTQPNRDPSGPRPAAEQPVE